jgi:D-xylose transport system permease protein
MTTTLEAPVHDLPETESKLAVRDLTMPLALLAIITFFGIRTQAFLGAQNLSNLAVELSITAVLALGMLLVILPGHIDLSAGSGVALVGGVAAMLITWYGWPAWLAMLAATAAALLIWGLMGLLIIKERVPAFIITLAGMLIFRGVHQRITQSATIPVVRGGETNIFSLLTTYYIPRIESLVLAAIIIVGIAVAAYSGYRRRKTAGASVDGELVFMHAFIASQLVLLFVLICNGYRGVPLSAVILGVMAVIIYVLTQHTPFGRHLYAIGGNEEAARVSGIAVDKVSIGAFVIMGLIVAVTGFLQTAYAGSTTPSIGEQMELDAVAACVIGGTNLKGGRGSVAGVLLGALIMATLLNGMGLMGMDSSDKLIARGVVLALAVWADVRLSRR